MTDTGEESGSGPLLKNRYRLGRVLGRGGMCIVYQAWDTRLQRHVAIKRLEPPLNQDPRTRARFDREGRALAQLSHPNLVTLIDRGSTETDDYLVFEYVEGRPLKELTREGPMSVKDAGRIAGQIAEGLAAAHRLGIIHRDIKPQNILIDRSGMAKVTDFGIATGPDWTRVTRAGSIIGSARYMSPEQIRSKPVDARSDIYSLGVVMYEMLAGRPPFDGTNMPEIARLHLTTPPPPLSKVRSDLPEGLEKVIRRCLEKMPEDRFSTMDELLGALVGLGIYSPQRTTEIAPPRRGSDRGTALTARRLHPPAVAHAPASAAEELDPIWVRQHARKLQQRRRRARRLKTLAVVVGLGLVALAVALPLTLSGGQAPNVLGLPLDTAKALAEEAGLVLEVADNVPSFDREPGIIIQQDPEPGLKPEDKLLYATVAREPLPVKVTKLDDVDPEGDAQENPDKLRNLVDGKDGTSWTTELYRSSAFGDLKTGVGFDFTLEEEASIIEIVAPVEGWKGQLLQRLTSGGTVKLATLEGMSTQIITLREPISSGRLWFTKLAPLTNTRWGAELAEIRFYR